MASDLLALESALDRLAGLVTPLPVEQAAPAAALGRYTAEPVAAQRTQPSADLSAMDGFAIAGAGPWQVVGESRCGAPYDGRLATGEATRVSTGAVMPTGAEAVLIKEDAQLRGDVVEATSAPSTGAHIRRAGFDFAKGDAVLSAGQRIGPAQLAVLLAAGCRSVPVRRAPTVTILECGDELHPAADTPGQLPPSNGAMLAAMCAREACETTLPAPLPDRLDPIAKAIDKAAQSDLVVISGGASVGDHDLVRPALASLDIEIDFWRVAMKPGKPLMVAQRGKQVIIGLPGNPVSSFVTGFIFVLCAIRAMLGAAHPYPRAIMLPAAQDLPAVATRREFLRAQVTVNGVEPLTEQDSSALLALSQADCLIERPEHSGKVKAGTPVPVYLLGNGGFA